MPPNIQYQSSTSHDTIAAIKADVAERFGTEIPQAYADILQRIQKTSGDFAESLKQEIEEEAQTMEKLKVFLETLLDMMEKASCSLDEVESNMAATVSGGME
ncbi:MAG: hypothetical protein GX234_03845 [Clostridiales bacterium]|nr:hypothetical protein [Clostridiales bacterium]